jgi:uncharacterized protein
VVESCVNHVGVELNTASAPLLANVAGIGHSLASKIVSYRESHGAFVSRQQLLKVPGLGPRAFEQAAGFLRLRNGTHPLDASAVHPERYALVESMAQDLGISVSNLMASNELIEKIDKKKYYSEGVGTITMQDILEELRKPGRDPRASFESPKFSDMVTTIQDVQVGMRLEGVVTNVTAFGAFVDIGVHQDGLIHLSELSDRFIKDAREEVQVGSKVTVEVLQVDVERRRISLTARIKRGALSPKKNELSLQKTSFVNNPFASL